MMTIGEFAQRARLSPKALRLYGELGLLVPARVDPNTGYRLYAEEQIAPARTIALLRRIGLPLAAIPEVLAAPPDVALKLLDRYWAQMEAETAERRTLLAYLQNQLKGHAMTGYDVRTRQLPDRQLVSITRHLRLHETDAFFADAFARLRAAGPGIEEIDGAPFLIFYGEVGDDSDGPLELCRPVGEVITALDADVRLRDEPAHDEAYVRLTKTQLGWPAMLPVMDALEAWTTGNKRAPAGAPRQVLIADQRTATSDSPVCDLAIPLGC